MSLKAWGLLLILSGIWGGSFFFNAISLRELPVLSTVFCRVALAAGFLLLILKLRGLRLDWQRYGATYLVLGLLNNVLPFSLIVFGQQSISSGLASILNAATPFSGIVIAHFALPDERMTLRKVVGVLIGLSGVAWMIGLSALQEIGDHLWAEVAVFGATVCYGMAGSFSKLRLEGVPALQSATGMLCASTVWLLLPTYFLDGLPEAMPSETVWGALLGLSLLSTGYAYLLFFRILELAGPTNLLLVTLLVPVSANLLGVALLGESLSSEKASGMVLLALGLMILDGRLWQAWQQRAPS
jgi:drug/metabolite transporter (DMT)-like permease